MRVYKAFLPFISAFVFLGCSDSQVDSTQVENRDLQALMEIEETGNQKARVVVELNEDNAFGSNVVLTDREFLLVSADGAQHRLLARDTDWLDVDYQGRFDVDDSSVDFTIDLYRSYEPDALNSRVTLPAAFTITAPTDGTTLYSDTPMRISWFPRSLSVPMRLDIDVTCASGTMVDSNVSWSQSIDIDDDNGFYEIDLVENFLRFMPMIDSRRDCRVRIDMERSQAGTILMSFVEGGLLQNGLVTLIALD